MKGFAIFIMVVCQLVGAIKIKQTRLPPTKLPKGEKLQTLFKGQPNMTMEIFEKLLMDWGGLNHILLEDVNELIDMIQHEFPLYVKTETIGESWQHRPIKVIELDATKLLYHQAQANKAIKE